MIIKIFLIFTLLTILKPIFLSIKDFKNFPQLKPEVENIIQKRQVISSIRSNNLAQPSKLVIKSYDCFEREGSIDLTGFISSGSPTATIINNIESGGISIYVVIRIIPTII